MQMLFMNWLVNDKMMQALCWTLLHSLWQGLLLAIIAALIIMITRKSSPGLRYNLLTALFILFIVITGFTLLRQIFVTASDQPEKVWISEVAGPVINTNTIHDDTIQSTTAEPGYFGMMVQYFNEHASLIVVIWLILFSVKLVKILSNIAYIQRIRHYKITEPSRYWKQRISELAQNLSIQHSIVLLESAIIKVPMVIGMLKPAILIPLGLLSNLPPEQVEAVLLHELAHIRRKDYLINLLQSFAEVVFFFNPAILWISTLIREERENCCDDVAISRIKNKKQFILALVAFQEYAMHQSNNSTAIAFAGRKKNLLNRVKRIIHNENKKLNAMEKGFFIFSIVVISLVGLVSMKQIPAQKAKSPVSVLPVTNALNTINAVQRTEPADTVPGPIEFKSLSSVTNKDDTGETRTITATDKNGKKYKMITKDDGPMELYINDKKIPAEEMDNYKKLIVAMEQGIEFRQKKDMEKMKKAQLEQSGKMMQLEAEQMQLMQKLSALDEEKAKLNYENMKEFKDHEWENAAKLNMLNDKLYKIRNENMDVQLLKKMLYNNQELLKQNMNNDNLLQKKLLNESLNKFNLDQLIQSENNQLYQKQLLNEKINLLHNNKWEQQQQRSYILIDPIIEDMVEENIIPPHQEEMSFELNDDKFIVNGKKQPTEVHDRFKKKYLKKDGDYFKFSRKNGSTSTTIHLD